MALLGPACRPALTNPFYTRHSTNTLLMTPPSTYLNPALLTIVYPRSQDTSTSKMSRVTLFTDSRATTLWATDTTQIWIIGHRMVHSRSPLHERTSIFVLGQECLRLSSAQSSNCDHRLTACLDAVAPSAFQQSQPIITDMLPQYTALGKPVNTGSLVLCRGLAVDISPCHTISTLSHCRAPFPVIILH